MLFQLRLSNRKRTVRLFGLRNPPPPLSETSSVKQSLGKKNRDLDESVNDYCVRVTTIKCAGVTVTTVQNRT